MSIFYVIFLLLTAYFSFRYDSIEEYDSHKQHRLWLMCGYLICLTGFSYGLGGDKFVYMEEFESYPQQLSEANDYIWQQFMLKGQMPLWTLVNIFCKLVFDSFYAVQLIQSAAINIAVCYLASKYTHRYFLFLLVYFLTLQYFIFNTEIMREGFAMAFALTGMYCYMNGRRWVFFAMLPIALLFHVSAAITLLFPFIRFRVSWRSLLYAVAIAFCLWLFSDLVLSKVIMGILGGMGAMVVKVLIYAIQATTIFGFIRSTFTFLIFPFIIMYTSMEYETSEELRKQKEKLLAFMMVLGIAASAFAGFTRLYNYVQIFYLILLADFIYIMMTDRLHLLMRLGAFAGTTLLILLTYTTKYKITGKYFYEFYYPYTCILDEDRDVYIREITHSESSSQEETDKNVRSVD
jgi:hypothetical protein